MRSAVVAAAALLLVGVLNTVPVQSKTYGAWFGCYFLKGRSCEAGWYRIDNDRCAKYIDSRKTFSSAKLDCRRSFSADLVSLHSEDQMFRLICLTWPTLYKDDHTTFWIGARTGGPKGGSYTDGSEFNYTRWYRGEPNNRWGREECVESNFRDFGYWNDVSCFEHKSYVCAKKM